MIKGRALEAVGFDAPFVYDKTFDTKKEADENFTLFMNHLVRAFYKVKPVKGKEESDWTYEQDQRTHRLVSAGLKPYLVDGVLPPALLIPRDEIAQIVACSFCLKWVKAELTDIEAFQDLSNER